MGRFIPLFAMTCALFYITFVFGFQYSVGSTLPPNKPRSSVHMLRGRFAAALGDFHTIRNAVLFTRQVKLYCLLFSLASRATTLFFKEITARCCQETPFYCLTRCHVKGICAIIQKMSSQLLPSYAYKLCNVIYYRVK